MSSVIKSENQMKGGEQRRSRGVVTGSVHRSSPKGLAELRDKEPENKATRVGMKWEQVGAAALPLLTAPAKS